MCAEYDKEFTWEIKAKQMGQTEQNAAKILIGKFDLRLLKHESVFD